ncbi:ESX secretion-associated protein EspG [Nocardia jiangsuensis]|uniref:ESX secretion-associated protein EspG n=1 Tax=Nocardia jiangsuensis TaxID=1691563 RepID=A0ABV8DX91_9NOCA
MNRSWSFTDVEFKVLWERINRRGLPRPFTFTSRTPLLDDYEREKLAIWERMRPDVDAELRDLFTAIGLPEVYVVVRGWWEDDPDNPENQIRARVVRVGVQGYLLIQQPGETLWHSGGFTIEECGPRGLVDAVLRVLPPSPAGRTATVPLVLDHADEHEYHRPEPDSLVTEARSESAADVSARFLAAPGAATGAISVHQGHSAFGPRGILKQDIFWRDMLDDGRYAIVLDQAPVAMGVDGRRLAGLVDAAVERMLERADAHWEAHS